VTGAPPDLPPAPPDAPPAPPVGPRGLPALGVALWEALLLYVVANIVLGGIAYAAIRGTAEEVPAANVIGGLAALDLVFLGAMICWLSWRHPGSWRALGIRVTWGAVGAGLGLGAALYAVVALGVGQLVVWVLEQLSGAPVEPPEQLPDDLHGGVAVLAVLVVVVLAPIAEELYFRGILFRSVRDVRGPGVGIAVSAALFGLVHYAPAEGAGELVLPLVMVLTGAVLAVLYERSGNLVVPIAAHMAFNAIGVTLILSGWG